MEVKGVSNDTDTIKICDYRIGSRFHESGGKGTFISQPSLSLAIRDLEEEIGVELFRRSSRGILLTPDGEEFIGYAKQVVEQYQLIESKYVQKEKVKKNSVFPCSIIPLRSMLLWRW